MKGRRRARRQAYTLPKRSEPAAPASAPAPVPAPEEYPRQLTTEELTGGKDDSQLTAELAAALRKIPSCDHCGGRHARACPRVKRLEFHPNGVLATVEFWSAGRWPETDIIWPEHLAEAEE